MITDEERHSRKERLRKSITTKIAPIIEDDTDLTEDERNKYLNDLLHLIYLEKEDNSNFASIPVLDAADIINSSLQLHNRLPSAEEVGYYWLLRYSCIETAGNINDGRAQFTYFLNPEYLPSMKQLAT